ncbi:MAG: hypothetical protein PVG07_14495 [Acidobacteriota bacterium]|jgi:hypothetical protein
MPEQASDVLIQVTFDAATNKIKADPEDATAKLNLAPPLVWQPATGLTIRYIGFAKPVGDDRAIDTPMPKRPNNPGVPWVALDRNPEAETFEYTIYAEKDGVVYSSDPRIVNEGQGGVDDEPGPGRRKQG